MRKLQLNNNQLKIIAVIAMLCDHIGKQLLPQLTFLQILGRLAFPIFAYMIAEGCVYTKNRKKYLLHILILGVFCQLVYFISEHSLYQNVLITFSFSVMTVFTVDCFIRKKNMLSGLLLLFYASAVVFIYFALPVLVEGFKLDYGFFGMIMPVAVYYAPVKQLKQAVMFVCLVLLSLDMGGIQWFSLISVVFILLYNQKRGKLNLKYLFYVFYPAHLAVIYLIKNLILSN